MRRFIVATVLLIVLLCSASTASALVNPTATTATTTAAPRPFRPYSKLTITPKTIQDIVNQAVAAQQLKLKNGGGIDLCPTCVQVTGQIINNLLNVIISGPVIGTCNKLCSLAVNELVGKLPPSVLQVLDVGCQLVCDYVGVTQFIKLVRAADLNPIWLCQEAKMCYINDCTAPVCAQFKEFKAIPESGRMGSTFNLIGVLQVFNQTGTGEHLIEIDPPAGMPLGDGQLVPKGFSPGVYNLNWQVTISNQGKSPDDPPFLPGVYKVGMAACEGQCGSRHAHTRTLATVFGSFTVVH